MSEKTSPKEIFTKLTPVILVVTVILSLAVSVLWQKVTKLEGGDVDKDIQEIEVEPDGQLNREKAEKVPEVIESDHVYGEREAQVSIIVYDDFECPFCKTFHKTVKDTVEDYQGKVNLVYRQFPLDMLHTKARTEAEATECVAKLGGNEAFWQFVDSILEATTSNDGLDLTLLPEFAQEAGIDKGKFQSCLDNRETKEIVEKQETEGDAAGVTGTPGVFVINKKGGVWRVPGAVPLEMLKTTLDTALE